MPKERLLRWDTPRSVALRIVWPVLPLDAVVTANGT
jgi:hypothetical protein